MNAILQYLDKVGSINERGNVLLLSGDGNLAAVFYDEATGDALIASYHQDDSPAFSLRTKAGLSKEGLTNLIREDFGGWYVRKDCLGLPREQAQGNAVAGVEAEAQRLAALLEAKETDDSILDEAVYELRAPSEACDINNGGFGRQITLILTELGITAGRQRIADALEIPVVELEPKGASQADPSGQDVERTDSL